MISLICGLVIATSGPIQDQESRKWALDIISQLRREGLLVGYPSFGRGTRPPTRYEMAVATHATYQHLLNIYGDVSIKLSQSHSAGKDVSTETKEDLAAVARMQPALDGLAKLGREYAYELKMMGVEEVQKDPQGFAKKIHRLGVMVLQLPARQQPFFDVPRDHWAAEAVHSLKRAGIVVGYPTASFEVKPARLTNAPGRILWVSIHA